MTKSLSIVALAVALGAGSLSAQGQIFWQEGGVVVCESTWAIRQAAASDDSGGVFVVWYDTRGENGSVRAQHVDRDGNAVWQRNGVFVRDGNPRGINQLSAVSDGRGGLVAVWQENDDHNTLYRHQVAAQRLDASGMLLWDSSGVVVAGADSGFRYEVAAVSDGRGGAIVAWTVVADSMGVDSLIVQRIDSLGNFRWGNPGLVMATESVALKPPKICSDGAGGACCGTNFVGSDWHAVAQHIDSAGHTTWPGGWVSLLPTGWYLCGMTCLPDGYRMVGKMADSINAQRVDDHGQVVWGPYGRSVYRLGSPIHTCVLPGPDSSSYVVWTEERTVRVISIYAQLLSGSGERQWDSLGVEVGTTNDNDSYLFEYIPAGDGFIASWPRNSDGPTDWDIYAQHVDAAGGLLWGDLGLGIATDSGRQCWEPCVVTDTREGAIVTWGYSYYGGHVGLSVQRVGDVTGVVSPVPMSPGQAAVRVSPCPARTAVEILPSRESESVTIADALGRVVRVLPLSPRGQRAIWDLRDVNGSRVPAGVYVFRQRDSGTSLGRAVVVNQ